MLKLEKIRAKSLLFLISGILVVSISFIFINCGEGPKSKALDPNKGAFAIDLSAAPPDKLGVINVESDALPNVANTEFTVEAWVKRKTTSTFEGGIFGRLDAKGIVLYVKNNEPKLAVRRNSSTSTAPVGCQSKVSGTVYIIDCIVGAGSELANDDWTHVAGVLVNSPHTHPTSSTCTTGVMAETPHMDIYIDGEFKNCGTTGGSGIFAGEPERSPKLATIGVIGEKAEPIDDTVGTGTRFNGVIDEVRFWTVARTQTQIKACMSQELSLTGGDCGIDFTILKGYWRFNEGTGSSTMDSSGHGSNGWIESLWPGAWTSGYPF